MRWLAAILTWWWITGLSSVALGEPVLLYFGPGTRSVGEIIEESTSEDRIRFELASGVVMTLPLSSVTRRYTGDFLNDYVRAEQMARKGDWVRAVAAYRQAAEKSPDRHFADEVLGKARDELIHGLPRLDRIRSCVEVERVLELVDPGDVEMVSRVQGAVNVWYRRRFNEWKAAADQAEVREDYRLAILNYSAGVECATNYPELRSEFLQGLARVHIKEGYRLYISEGPHDVVVDHVRAAIKASPDYQQAHLLKADVFCALGEELLDQREERIQEGDVSAAASLLAEASAAFREVADSAEMMDRVGGIPLGTRNHIHSRALNLHNRLKARQEAARRPWRRLEDIPPRSLIGRIGFYARRGWRSVAGNLFQPEFWRRNLEWVRARWVTLFLGLPLPIAATIFLDRRARREGVLKEGVLRGARVTNAVYCILLLTIAWWLRSADEAILFAVACFLPVSAYLVYARFLYQPAGVCPSCGAQVLDYEEYEDLDFSRCPHCRAPLETPLTLRGYIEEVAGLIERGPAGADAARRWDSEGVLHQRDRMLLLIRLLITHALRRRASDIHVELDHAYDGKRDLGIRCRVRLRVDGVLFYEVDFSALIHSQLVSAIKGMANMDVADRLHPQDGHFHQTVDGADIQIRASTSPTSTGEKLVLRLLDKRQVMRAPDELGFHSLAFIEFENAIHSPQGIILATGPSGSGKTTLLYSALCTLLDGEKSVVSIEDPIEYDVSGINQIQHDPKLGVTFSNALRNILRQDPDIIMVGEIRDSETTQMVVEAAKTGHLVFSTLHTTDACTAAFRLIDLGTSSQDTAATLRAVVAQRLVRVICPHCKVEAELTPEQRRVLAEEARGADIRMWQGKGCEACRGTGYLGRTGLFEVLSVSEEIRELIAERASLASIRRSAAAAGMKTLWEDGMLKVAEGITTVEEVLRVARRVSETAAV